MCFIILVRLSSVKKISVHPVYFFHLILKVNVAQLRIDSTEKHEYMFVPRVFRIRLLINMPCIYANGLNDYVNTVALRFIGKCVRLVLLSMSYQSQHKITLLVINQNLQQASRVKA